MSYCTSDTTTDVKQFQLFGSNSVQKSSAILSQPVKAFLALILLALLCFAVVIVEPTKNGARGLRAPGARGVKNKNVTYPNYTTLCQCAQSLCCQALARYFRTDDSRHLAIYDTIKNLVGGEK